MEFINDKRLGNDTSTTQVDAEISFLDDLQLVLVAGGIGDVVPA